MKTHTAIRFGLLAVVLALVSLSSHAQPAPPPLPSGRLLDVWEFSGTNFLSEFGYAPTSLTNVALVSTWAGNGLQVDDTNAAWIIYPVVEPNGHTNLNCAEGTLETWFSADWNSSDGIGNWGTVLEVGTWNTNLSATTGAWGLYVSPDASTLFFSAETNGVSTNYLNAPIAWNAGDWHHIAITYSATNSTLYLEGQFVTNGPGVTVIPGADVLTNGFSIGSDGNGTGLLQIRGVYNNLISYNYQLDANTISNNYAYDSQNVYPLPSSGFGGGGSHGDYTPDVPGGGSGTNSGTNGGGSTFYSPSYTTNDFYLTVLALGTNIYNSDSNSITVILNNTTPGILYQLWFTTNLQGTNTVWTLETNVFGSWTTNFSVAMVSMTNGRTCFFKGLSYLLDSDNDGLPDAFEMAFSHTNPNLWDSNGNGIGDGDELSPSGLPWRLVMALQTSAVIVANVTNATEGGSCGQCTVYLPTPAPSGGTVVQYLLGGMAAQSTDYSITPTGSLTISAGATSGTISICALTTTNYSDFDRYVTVTLTNASSCPVDGTPAQVNLIDSNLPGVRVFALPNWVRNPSPTFGTNSAAFYFVRDGIASNSLAVC